MAYTSIRAWKENADSVHIVKEWYTRQSSKVKSAYKNATLLLMNTERANWGKPFYKDLDARSRCYGLSEIRFACEASEEIEADRLFRALGAWLDGHFVILAIGEKNCTDEDPKGMRFYQDKCMIAQNRLDQLRTDMAAYSDECYL